jgi:hypothetical protein
VCVTVTTVQTTPQSFSCVSEALVSSFSSSLICCQIRNLYNLIVKSSLNPMQIGLNHMHGGFLNTSEDNLDNPSVDSTPLNCLWKSAHFHPFAVHLLHLLNSHGLALYASCFTMGFLLAVSIQHQGLVLLTLNKCLSCFWMLQSFMCFV